MADNNKFDPKKEVVKITKFMYDRRLTYATGGNWVLKHNNKYYCTPTGLGRYYLYELSEDDVVVCDANREVIEGTQKITVASNVHFSVLEAFPEYNASMHTHGEFSTVFASTGKPIPAVTIPISYYCGEVPIIKFDKDFEIVTKELIKEMKKIKDKRSKDFSRNVKNYIGYKDIRSIPVAVLIEGEGLMIAAPDLKVGAVTAEAIEEAGRCIIFSSGISSLKSTSRSSGAASFIWS